MARERAEKRTGLREIKAALQMWLAIANSHEPGIKNKKKRRAKKANASRPVWFPFFRLTTISACTVETVARARQLCDSRMFFRSVHAGNRVCDDVNPQL